MYWFAQKIAPIIGNGNNDILPTKTPTLSGLACNIQIPKHTVPIRQTTAPKIQLPKIHLLFEFSYCP